MEGRAADDVRKEVSSASQAMRAAAELFATKASCKAMRSQTPATAAAAAADLGREATGGVKAKLGMVDGEGEDDGIWLRGGR